MLRRRHVLCASLLAPLLTLSACDQIQEVFASDKEKEVAEEKARRDFARRPSPAQRAVETGVEEAFMVEAPETGAQLGWGWSVSRGQIIPTVCVEFAEYEDPAQTTTLNISEVRDSSELSKSMNISSSVSVKTLGYKGSGKAKFATDTKVSSFSTTVVIEAEVRNGAHTAGPKPHAAGEGAAVTLTADKAALAKRDLEAFQEACGEGYISARMTGAEAYAVIEIKTSSKTEKQKVSTKLSAEGMGAKFKGAFGSSSGSSTDSFSRDIRFYQAGGTGNQPPIAEGTEKDADVIIARIKGLAEDAIAAGKTFSLEITPYQVLENFPRGKELVADADETDEIAAAYGLYSTVYNDIASIFEPVAKVVDTGDIEKVTTPIFVMPVAICGEGGKLSSCRVEMKPVQPGPIQIDASMTIATSTLTLLGALQDVALIGKDRIELEAADCLEDEDDCEFSVGDLRSVYAARSGMPIRSDWVADPALADQTAFHLRGPAHARCAISSLEPGCVSNAEIEGWIMRSGFTPVTAVDDEALDRVATALDRAGAPFIRGDADRPDALTVWVPPANRVLALEALANTETPPES